MEYIYYLIDYYDFSFAPILRDQDALGFCRSYELYGKGEGSVSWKAGQELYMLYPHVIVKYN